MSHAWNGPDPTQSADGGSYSLGATFTANSPITVTGIRVWAGASPGVRANRRGRLWSDSQAQLAIATLPDSLPAGWSEYDFASPVDLTSGQQATIAWDTAGFYGEENGAFDAAVTSPDGLVTFLAAGTAPHGNGSFTTSVGAFPDVAASHHTFYGVDIVYTATGGNTPPTIVGMTAAVAGDTVTSVINATDQEGLTGATYTWDFGDGTVVSQSTNTATHTYVESGQYAVVGTVTDSGGLTSAPKGVPVFVVLPASGFDAQALTDAVVSMATGSGLFGDVAGHEPASLPSVGMNAAVWMQGISPAKRISGLSETAARVEYRMRIYAPMATGQMDSIDPAMTTAAAQMIRLLSADFTLGGEIFAADLLGAHGAPLSARADYYKQGDQFYRIYDITVPFVVDNVWAQGAVQ